MYPEERYLLGIVPVKILQNLLGTIKFEVVYRAKSNINQSPPRLCLIFVFYWKYCYGLWDVEGDL